MQQVIKVFCCFLKTGILAWKGKAKEKHFLNVTAFFTALLDLVRCRGCKAVYLPCVL